MQALLHFQAESSRSNGSWKLPWPDRQFEPAPALPANPPARRLLSASAGKLVCGPPLPRGCLAVTPRFTSAFWPKLAAKPDGERGRGRLHTALPSSFQRVLNGPRVRGRTGLLVARAEHLCLRPSSQRFFQSKGSHVRPSCKHSPSTRKPHQNPHPSYNTQPWPRITSPRWRRHPPHRRWYCRPLRKHAPVIVSTALAS